MHVATCLMVINVKNLDVILGWAVATARVDLLRKIRESCKRNARETKIHCISLSFVFNKMCACGGGVGIYNIFQNFSKYDNFFTIL